MTVCRAPVIAAVLVIGVPAAGFAQTSEAQTTERKTRGRPLFVAGALYDARSRATAEGGVLIPFKVGWADDDVVLMECRCLSVTAGLGAGGYRLAAGPTLQLTDGFTPLLTGALDAVVTVLRTTDAPRGARPDTTYVGAEGGVTFLSVRVGVGFAHRVAGPAPHDTVVTWNVGFRTVW